MLVSSEFEKICLKNIMLKWKLYFQATNCLQLASKLYCIDNFKLFNARPVFRLHTKWFLHGQMLSSTDGQGRIQNFELWYNIKAVILRFDQKDREPDPYNYTWTQSSIRSALSKPTVTYPGSVKWGVLYQVLRFLTGLWTLVSFCARLIRTRIWKLTALTLI